MKHLSRLILFAALAPISTSQSVLHTFHGDSPNDLFGTVSSAGDVNADGFDDLVVGAAMADNHGTDSGSVRVFSGLDGSILYTFDGDSAGDSFGISVSGAGDVNGDGYDDLIVGACYDDNHGDRSGSARVFSGLDGSILYTFDGDSADDRFGGSVSGAGDVNADGFDDLIVGARDDDNNGTQSGSARVFSGLDGSILYTFDGDSPDDRFGKSVSGAGDVNADGHDDLLVGATMDDNNGPDSGSARVFSGLDGSILYTFDGESQYDRLGFSVSGAGDVNGDGYADVIAGARIADNHGDRSGSALVFSGRDGSILYTFDGDSQNDLFGVVSGAGDLNGDGYDDLLVGAALDDNQGKNSGSVRAFSGRDGSVLYTLDGESPDDRFGFSVSGAGDVNGDGYDDLIVGAWGDDTHGQAAGSARVFSGSDARDASPRTPAVPGESDRSAAISEHVSDLADSGTFTLHAADLPPNRVSYFFPSQTRGFVPHPRCIQASRCLGGNLARFRAQIQKSGPRGELSIEVALTSIPTAPPQTVMAGEAWKFQCWFRGDQGGPASNFTDGIVIVFQ